MRKWVALVLVLVLLLSACGQKTGDVLENPDITCDQISWSLAEEEIDENTYVVCSFTNNSSYTITSLRMSFTGKEDLTEAEADEFYLAVQNSQNFSDSFMEDFRSGRAEKGLSISMYAQADERLAPQQVANSVKCYYCGGFTSKDMPYSGLFVPEILQITYEKNGRNYSIDYEFASGGYTVAEVQGD